MLCLKKDKSCNISKLESKQTHHEFITTSSQTLFFCDRHFSPFLYCKIFPSLFFVIYLL
nr:MAG TPA: hypothetical protein [Caudoviricetes sp.]